MNFLASEVIETLEKTCFRQSKLVINRPVTVRSRKKIPPAAGFWASALKIPYLIWVDVSHAHGHLVEEPDPLLDAKHLRQCGAMTIGCYLRLQNILAYNMMRVPCHYHRCKENVRQINIIQCTPTPLSSYNAQWVFPAASFPTLNRGHNNSKLSFLY